jgi:hypothetical protein
MVGRNCAALANRFNHASMKFSARIHKHLTMCGPDQNKNIAEAIGASFRTTVQTTKRMAARGELTFEVAPGLHGPKKKIYTTMRPVEVAADSMIARYAPNELWSAWG